MPTACVLRDRCRVQLTGERLEVWGPASDCDEPGDKVVLLREIPLRDVERVVISESTHVTTPALAELLRRAIPLSLLDWKGEFLGGFQPPPTAHGAARLR